MRCPKCDYISFDHLAACGICSRDLTAIAEELHGTSIESDLSLFLGSVIGMEPTADEMEFYAQDSMTNPEDELVFASDDLPEEQEITIQLDEPPNAPETAEVPLVLEPEVPSELTLDMDEIPTLDFSQIEEEANAEEVPSDQTEMLFAEAGEFHEGQNEQLTLNLDEIDLSDLAPFDEDQTESAGTSQTEADPEIEPEITLDLGMNADADSADTLDLGAAKEEEYEIPILDLEDFMMGNELESTDDTNELEALLSNKAKGNEGAGQQAPKATAKKKSVSPELKLTLESDDE